MKILIAEDDEASAVILRKKLTDLGHESVIAYDGIQAWRAHQAIHYPVVISDWMMPSLDGISLCRRIRGLDNEHYTYIILTTVRTCRADRMEGLRAGADDFLTKPIDPEELMIRLEIARRLLAVQDRLRQQNVRLTQLAATDELTGLANRREFWKSMSMCFDFASRHSSPLSLILVDIDRFKSYNDTFGHLAGDDALRRVAEVLRACGLNGELAARYGGDEFVILLPNAGRDESRDIAEQIRSAIDAHDWPHRPLTASIGVVTLTDEITTIEKLIEKADSALYRSKQRDRNCVTRYEDLEAETAGFPTTAWWNAVCV